ncbi:permease-like cell division protein FtsX [Actinoplanes sp. NPDC049265]|uniref:permease-like cell division protein FtsX n=1 Tax=Actinoplanes sp. NPDC049265 TaxID=3363902 RepID=UPI00371D0AD9
MEPNLRKHFDLAVIADPGADPGEMAAAAMAQGGRSRRKRRQLAIAGAAAGVVVVLVTAAGMGPLLGTRVPDHPRETIAAGMMLAAPDCSVRTVETDATDVAIFLTDEVTDRQRTALSKALNDDARVTKVLFESRQEAYAKFVKLWADNPDFVKSVTPRSLPESFRLRLASPATFVAFNRDYGRKAGVQDIIGRSCPESAPVGGVL